MPKRLRCRYIALTYDDPEIWAEYAIDAAKANGDLWLRSELMNEAKIKIVAGPRERDRCELRK